MQIGDYARTINGKIWVIKSQQAISGHKKDIIKSSPNLIDLIEVGDYVNGYKITDFTEIDKYNDEKILYADLNVNLSSEYIAIHEDEIKSIVTKEQFESMEYRIGE